MRVARLLLLVGLGAASLAGCDERATDAPPPIDQAAMRPNGSRKPTVVFIDGVAVPAQSASAAGLMAPAGMPGEGVEPPPSRPADVRWLVPPGWVATPPASQMRAAQYKIPRAQGDEADAELAVYYFGPQGAGEADETLDRWAAAFSQVEGAPQKARFERANVLEVKGAYAGDHAMGGGAEPSTGKPGWALLGAVVQTPLGPYYFKMLGPARTLSSARDGFLEMVRSVGMSDAPAGSASAAAASAAPSGQAPAAAPARSAK